MEQKELDGKVWEVDSYLKMKNRQNWQKRKWKESSTYMII